MLPLVGREPTFGTISPERSRGSNGSLASTNLEKSAVGRRIFGPIHRHWNRRRNLDDLVVRLNHLSLGINLFPRTEQIVIKIPGKTKGRTNRDIDFAFNKVYSV